MKRLAAAVVGLLLTAGCARCPRSAPRAAEMWLTTADETQKLAPQPILAPARRRDGRRSRRDRSLRSASSRCTASARR